MNSAKICTFFGVAASSTFLLADPGGALAQGAPTPLDVEVRAVPAQSMVGQGQSAPPPVWDSGGAGYDAAPSMVPPGVEGDPDASSYGGFCYVGPHPADTRVTPGSPWDATQGQHVRPYAPIDLRLFSYRDGCYYFIGDPRDFGYEGQVSSYYGAHPVLAAYGGGWCFMMGGHSHIWSPWSSYFTVVGPWYYWRGPYDPYFWTYWPYYSTYYRAYYPHYYGGGRFYRGGYRAAPPFGGRGFRGGPPAVRSSAAVRGAAGPAGPPSMSAAARAPSPGVSRGVSPGGMRPVSAAPTRGFPVAAPARPSFSPAPQRVTAPPARTFAPGGGGMFRGGGGVGRGGRR